MAPQLDTAQQRAEEFVECVLSFIEKTSGRKIQFKTIVDMSTGTQSNPTERLVAAITNRDKQARREALEEAARVADATTAFDDNVQKSAGCWTTGQRIAAAIRALKEKP